MPTQARARTLERGSTRPSTSTAVTATPAGAATDGDPRATAEAIHNEGLFQYQYTDYDAAEVTNEFAFPDFFDQVMNMPSGEVQEPSVAPPNVFNFTSDDLGLLDYDFGLLAGGLTRPPSAQGTRQKDEATAASSTSPQSEAQLRADAFERSPWSWNHWIPTKKHNTFFGQDEINITAQRVNANDQLTPGSGPRPVCGMELEARDRILRLVTSVAASRLSVSSFPSPDLLNDLVNVFVLQESDSIDSYMHWPSLDIRSMRTETLLGVLSKGAVFVALQPVWKIGLVFQEIVRLAVAETFERDNSTTRQLQPLQAYMLDLDVGLWSGFRRKTEISSSFLQPVATMLSWSGALQKFRYEAVEPNYDDDASSTESKWKSWIEQESLKRLVLHAFIHDSQASLAHSRDPLFSPSRMQLPLPLSLELWHAPDAQSWKMRCLTDTRSGQDDLPSVVSIAADIQVLQRHGSRVDQRLSVLDRKSVV